MPESRVMLSTALVFATRPGAFCRGGGVSSIQAGNTNGSDHWRVADERGERAKSDVGGALINMFFFYGPKIDSELSNMLRYLTIRYPECFIEKK